jgi:RNA polymerase sigma-70 factor (ECF subfamily)
MTTDVKEHADLGFDVYRPELTAYCYRMLGSPFEAQDAVQETLVRAWKAIDGFEGRAALRSWLYRIASNVCFDMLKGRERRALPMDLCAVGAGDGQPGPVLPEATWIGPIPDRLLGDPAAIATTRDSVRVAFIAALQHLPPRQRAVLILREVLEWSAAEVAVLLETSVASVNSALQRARATLAERDLSLDDAPSEPADDDATALLERYVEAFERFDIDALVALLHDDATMTMPPYLLWLRGPDELAKWLRGEGRGCAGSRVAPVRSNGSPAFAQWRVAADGNGYDAWSIHVVDVDAGGIRRIEYFVDPAWFALFELPAHLDG